MENLSLFAAKPRTMDRENLPSENPYSVLGQPDRGDRLAGSQLRHRDPGRWIRTMQVMASIIAIFSLLVMVASVYEVWGSYGAPPPWNSPRWRQHYINSGLIASGGCIASFLAFFQLPTRTIRGHVFLGGALFLQLLLLGVDF